MIAVDLTRIAPFLAGFARATAFLYAAPLVGDAQVPHKVRIAGAALLSMALSSARPPMDPADLFLALPGEIGLGLLAGFTGRVVLAGAEAGGDLIGVNLGLGFAASFDPSLGDSALPTRRLMFALAGLAFLGAGGLESTIPVLAAPAPGLVAIATGTGSIIHLGGEVLAAAVRFAAPVMIAVVVANLATALASRAAPALNVFSINLPLILVLGAVVLIATAPTLVAETVEIARHAADSILEVVR